MDSASSDQTTTDRLIDACLCGDQPAWTAIVQRYQRRVFNVAFTFVGKHDEAEDLTQDIFLRVYKALGTFDRRANFQTWLISISRNLCIDHYRSVRKERELVDRNVDTSSLFVKAKGADPLSRLQRLDRRGLLRQGMLTLPESLRIPVLLRDIQGLSYQEIAERLALPEGTVKSRINRGRSQLARRIRKLDREKSASAAAPPSSDTAATTGAQE